MPDTPRNRKGKNDDYIVQGTILAAAVVITKVIGVVYRIPLTNILGDEGNGFYGYALSGLCHSSDAFIAESADCGFKTGFIQDGCRRA